MQKTLLQNTKLILGFFFQPNKDSIHIIHSSYKLITKSLIPSLYFLTHTTLTKFHQFQTFTRIPFFIPLTQGLIYNIFNILFHQVVTHVLRWHHLYKIT
jgi:hypothetical protein